MADTTLITAFICVLVAALYFTATRRSRFSLVLDYEVKTDPETCVQYMAENMDEVLMKGHPYMVRVEQLKNTHTGDKMITETNYHESVPIIPFIPYKKDTVLHGITEFDLKKRELKSYVDNSRSDTAFLGLRINLTWTFDPHPTRAGWTIIKDVIDDDTSLGMSYLIASHQRTAHDQIFKEVQLNAPKYKIN